MTVKKKVFWISTLIIIAAIAIVLCFGLINNHPTEYDGTLVQYWQNEMLL
jgi:hypothetical protein